LRRIAGSITSHRFVMNLDHATIVTGELEGARRFLCSWVLAPPSPFRASRDSAQTAVKGSASCNGLLDESRLAAHEADCRPYWSAVRFRGNDDIGTPRVMLFFKSSTRVSAESKGVFADPALALQILRSTATGM